MKQNGISKGKWRIVFLFARGSLISETDLENQGNQMIEKTNIGSSHMSGDKTLMEKGLSASLVMDDIKLHLECW